MITKIWVVITFGIKNSYLASLVTFWSILLPRLGGGGGGSQKRGLEEENSSSSASLKVYRGCSDIRAPFGEPYAGKQEVPSSITTITTTATTPRGDTANTSQAETTPPTEERRRR
ncbi:hypothetical protein GIB67_036168 [Kingdonia uniflora]|uniref:Uncharacterized protein n=1 Tax=Kingdonia uniflora TaxID=39325 RepID=A0A7J7N9Z9_9MAGN|nr:hypothetical protein GIB67_036168 [Kingdonia uniflora]